MIPFLLAPIAIVVAFSLGRESPDQLVTAAEPVMVPVRQSVEADPEPLELVAEFSEGAPLLSPPGSGTVTEILIESGQTIENGTVLYSVDGQAILALRSDVPLYRTIERGDEGRDVDAVRDLYRHFELEIDEDDPDFDYTMQQTTRDFREFLGWDRAGKIEPDQFVWLPTESFEVGDVELITAGAAPEAGEGIFTPTPTVDTVGLQTKASEAPFRFDQPLTLTIGDTTFDVSSSDTLQGNVPDAVVALLENETDDDGLARLDVSAQWAAPEQSLAVPNSSVMSSTDGAINCVWTATSSSRFEPRQVEPSSGDAAFTNLTSIEPDIEVLANPIEVLDDPQCRSSS